MRARHMAYSTGETFWVPADGEPRCALEALALDIFRFHTAGARFRPGASGAEWWTQVIHTQDDIGWHFDKDYGMERAGVNVHPHLGTVTYLCAHGGPTVVLDHAGALTTAEPCDREDVPRAWLSVPRLGKHMCFDGRHLHGAPADVADLCGIRDRGSRARPRVTFLVNVWLNHRPEYAAPLAESEARALSAGRVPVQWPPGRPEGEVMALPGGEGSLGAREVSWEFGESLGEPGEQEDVPHRVRAVLPAKALFKECARGREAFCVELPPGSCSVRREGA